jgi:hypothetical protein
VSVNNWETISSLATAVGTLALAVVTVVSLRSANRAARVAEAALIDQRRPVLVASRLSDPMQKIMFIDQRWFHVEGGHGIAEHSDGVVYLAISLRNIGTGIAVMQAWAVRPGVLTSGELHLPVETLRHQTRDLYIPAGDVGLWQGALRDPDDDAHAPIAEAIATGQPITVDLLYSDHLGAQRAIARVNLVPVKDGQWLSNTGVHWELDRQDPRHGLDGLRSVRLRVLPRGGHQPVPSGEEVDRPGHRRCPDRPGWPACRRALTVRSSATRPFGFVPTASCCYLRVGVLRPLAWVIAYIPVWVMTHHHRRWRASCCYPNGGCGGSGRPRLVLIQAVTDAGVGILRHMPAGTQALPSEARAALEEYLAALDAALPRLARGIYITGSAVLGDWQPGRSDLDILTVTGRSLDDAELAALEALHAGMPGRPYRDAIYIPAEAVGARPAPDGDGDGYSDGYSDGGTAPDTAGRYPNAVDGVFQRARYRPDPVLWATLHRHGLTVRGPAARTLGADPGQAWLRDWNRGNLESYWRPWAANARKAMAGHAPADALDGYTVAWAALGPGRLHATISTGEIIAKTAAADYTARLFPEHMNLLARAKAYRLGDDGGTFTVEDGRAACDLVEAVVNDAASLP